MKVTVDNINCFTYILMDYESTSQVTQNILMFGNF